MDSIIDIYATRSSSMHTTWIMGKGKKTAAINRLGLRVIVHIIGLVKGLGFILSAPIIIG